MNFEYKETASGVWAIAFIVAVVIVSAVVYKTNVLWANASQTCEGTLRLSLQGSVPSFNGLGRFNGGDVTLVFLNRGESCTKMAFLAEEGNIRVYNDLSRDFDAVTRETAGIIKGE